MKKFKGYLICTDCDGTLMDQEGKVSSKNAEAIKYFQEEGGLFTLATGRFPNHAKLFEKQFRINAPMVSLNGAVIYDIYSEKVINKWPITKERCKDVLEFIYNNWNQTWEYWVSSNNHISTGYILKEHQYKDGSLQEWIASFPDEIFKMVIMQPEDVTPKIQQELRQSFGQQFRFDTSWANGLEVQSISSGKGIAVQYLKNYVNEDIHTTVGIGDYENDITLLQYSDIGYAVNNGIDSVKKVADRITVSNNESAIAAVIEDLELMNSSR